MPDRNRNRPCPCRSGRKYKRCCEPWHRGRPAPTAEALMRSRYSAYALGLVAYVQETTHPDGPHFEADRVAWQAGIEAFAQATRFQALQISEHSEDGDQAWVTFTAGLAQGEQDASFTERSHFLRVDGRWLYLAGERLG